MSEGGAQGTARALAPIKQKDPQPPVESAGLLSPEDLPVRHHPIFQAIWYASNALLILAILLAVYAAIREYSTRRYLKGFSDAVVPESSTPIEKVEAIVNWMANGPARQPGAPDQSGNDRNPTDTLNYASLLQVCGSATNAFINLADSAGLTARRLLLLNSHDLTNHVVAEVLIDGRWIVVDPAYRTVFRGVNGQLLTREELSDPSVWTAATKGIRNYGRENTFNNTAHVRLSRLPFIGRALREALDRHFPGWDDSAALSLLLERESLALMVFAITLVSLLAVWRVGLRWYGETRLEYQTVRFRSRFRRAFHALADIDA